MSFQLVYLSQQDSQWKNDLLGFGDPGDTIGKYGCALTSVAMLVSGHGYPETPKTLNDKLKANQGFVSSGIRWDVVARVHPQITLRENITCETTDAPLAKIDAALAAGQPVVVRVDSSPAPGLQWHYVMVYARKGNDYLMLDPWPYNPGTAKEDYLMARYSRGNPLQRAIQQVLIYQCSTSGGTISLPSTPSTTTNPPPTQPTTDSALGTGPRARVMDAVTWGLNIRSSTDTSSLANLVVNVPAGGELALLEPNAESKIGVNGQWVRVRTAQGQEGYAAAWYLEKVAAANPPVSTPPVSSPVSDAPASSSTPASTTDSSSTSATSTPDSSTTSSPTTTTPTKPPDPPKVQVVVNGNGTNVYAATSGFQVISVEKANARLTIVESPDTAKAKIGVKGQRINVKASNNKRGYIDGDKVKSA